MYCWCWLLLYVISVCKRVTLPPGLHPIAVKYIIHSFKNSNLISYAAQTNSVVLLCRGAKYFPEIYEPYRHSRRQKSNMKQGTYWRHRDIGRHLTKFSCHGDQAPGVCAPLFLRMVFGLKEQYELDVSKDCNTGESLIIKTTVFVPLFMKTST